MDPTADPETRKSSPMKTGAWTTQFRAVLVAGMLTAIFEMIFVLPIQWSLGASPQIVFQSIASGVLGKAAFAGGLNSAYLGVAIHVLISVVAAAVYVLAARRWPVLLSRAIASGMIFGVLVYLVMTFIVVPLSVIGFRFPKSVGLAVVSFAIHVFAFGLPIALLSRWLLRDGPASSR